MAVSQEQKVDFLLKKIGFTASKTGSVSGSGSVSGTAKAGFAEAVPSPLVIASTSVWADSTFIPATPPGSDSAYVKVYLSGTSGLRMTYDNTVSNQRSFIARSTYGNQTSAILGDWIDTQFGSSYIIKVYKGDPNSGGVQLSAAGSGSNDGWFFDYSSGILNFNDTNVPSGVTDTNIYIVGYRYTGTKGLQPPAGIGTFSSLYVTGISTFLGDVNFIGANSNIQFDQSDSALDFADNSKARFGTSDDLSIYHSSSTNNSIISNTTGILQILGDDVRIKNAANNADLARFIGGGAASLYHNNTARLYTTATGAEVFGNLNVTGVLTYDDVTNIDSIGIVTARTGVHVLANGINVVGVSTFADGVKFNGFVDLGNATSDTITATGRFDSNVVPSTDSAYDLGTSSLNWRTVYADSIDLPGGPIGEDIITRNLKVTGLSTFTGAADFNGNVDIDGTTELDDVNVSAGATFAGVIDANSNVDVAGNVTVTGNLDVDGHTELDNVNISGLTTAALLNVSSLTDTRVTYASASGRLVDSANLTFDGTNLTAASAKITDLTSGRVVLAGTSGALEDSGNLTFNGSLLNITGGLDVSGDADIDGTTELDDVNVSAGATFGGLVDINAGAQANTLKVEDLTSGRVVLAGAGGELQDNSNLTFDGWTLSVTGNVSIGGTLTYQDVTNVDSLGIATARTGLHVLANGIVVNSGVSTFTHAIDANGGADIAGVSTISNLRIGNAINIDIIRDEDDMASDDPNALATQQSIKAYVDAGDTAQDLDFVGDTGSGAVDLDSATFRVTGTPNEIVTTASGLVLNVSLPDDVTIGNNLTVSAGLNVVGVSTFAGNIDANGNLDVDGQTDLDVLNVSDTATFAAGFVANGTVDLGNATSDTITATGRFDSHLIPTADGTYDLGSSTLEWRKVYAKNIGIGTTGGGGIGDDIVTRNLLVTGLSTFRNDMQLDHNGSQLKFGTGSGTLFLKGDSANGISYIEHGATGDFNITSDGDVVLRRYSGGPHEVYAKFIRDGSVDLYYDNTKRFSTSGIGVTITGETKTTNLNVTGIATVTGIIDGNGGANISGGAGLVASTAKVSDLTSGRVVIAGTSGEIEDSGNLTFNGTKLEVTGTTDTDQLIVSGVSTFTGAADFNGDIDVDGHTELDNLRVSGVSTLTGNVVTGSDVSFSGANYNASWIKTGDKLRFNDNASATFGTQDDLQIYHNNTSGYIRNVSGNLRLQPKAGEQGIILKPDGAVEAYFDNSKKVSTSGIGVTIYTQLDVTNINATGVVTATKFVGGGTVIGDDVTTRNLSVTGLSTFTGAIDANGDLDVDGHAEFDNIRVAGVSTFAGQVNAGAIAAASATFTGNVTVGGTLTYEDVTNVDSVGIVTARTDLHVGTGATTIKTLNGKVGINSTVPVHTLDVGGVINSSTDIRINNVSVGGGASLDDVTALAIALG